MTTQPVPVPTPASPPIMTSTEQMPSTPPMSRPRSDTMQTTSSASSSSSPHLQTPQTPSILGVLDGHARHRADSYGFGEFGKALFQESLNGRRSSDALQIASTDEVEEVEGLLPALTSTPLVVEASDEAGRRTPVQARPITPRLALVSADEGPSPLLIATSSTSETAPSSSPKGKSKAGQAVRAKLQRSKSSIKEVFRVKNSHESGSGDTIGLSSPDSHDVDNGKRRPRLRSLLSFSRSGSRSSSTVSVRTLSSATAEASGRRLPVLDSTQGSGTGQIRLNGVLARDFGSPGTPAVQPPSHRSVVDHTASIEALGDGRLEISASRPRRRVRPMSTSTLSSGHILHYRPLAPPITRSVTAPILAEGSFHHGPASHTKPKRDLFTEMLPRELKVMVLKTVLDMGSQEERQSRWDGEVAARRELIQLSRVSRAWQALCFDGQLWPVVDLAPLASRLHPGTIKRLLEHAGPFVKTLSLRGMDALKGVDLVTALARCSLTGTQTSHALANLASLDLRGCKKLESGTLLALIAASPNLRVVNLKGVQAVSSEVIRTLARTATHLESLDVSRCWDISLCDLSVFVKMLPVEQAARLKVLRAGGMKAYGTTGADFMPLVLDRLFNLETLDLLGCTHIHDADLIRACNTLAGQSRQSSLSHLVLSGCVLLTAAIFPAMRQTFPNLTRLELASIPEMFEEGGGDGVKALHSFIKSLDRLEKLDLDATGSNAGVNDKLLEILTPARGEFKSLNELRIGYAKGVTPEGMIRFIRGCTTLRIFEADNTSATNAVMREFYRRHAHNASISLVDCRAITPVSYSHISSSSRPRDGFTGYPAIPMGYDEGELDDRVIVKVFWSWRRVGVAKGWRETLRDKEREYAESRASSASASPGTRTPVGRAGRGKGWWKNDETFDDRAGCVVQ